MGSIVLRYATYRGRGEQQVTLCYAKLQRGAKGSSRLEHAILLTKGEQYAMLRIKRE